MESLSVGEIRVIYNNLLWLVESLEEGDYVLCRYKRMDNCELGWSKKTYKLTARSILESTGHYGYLITDLENE